MINIKEMPFNMITKTEKQRKAINLMTQYVEVLLEGG